MAVPDMNISLNITAEPIVTAGKKQKRAESFKNSVKRLRNQSFRKGIIRDNKETKKNINIQEAGVKKRIKQKSLSAIFTKKLKETNAVLKNVPQILSQNKDIATNVTEREKIETSNVINKKSLELGKDLSTVNSNITSESIVSFTKMSKECIGKTLLAREKNISKKKTLSDIFSSQSKNQNESDTLNLIKKCHVNESTKSNKSKIIHKDQLASKETKKINSNKMIGKKDKEKILDNDPNRKPKLMYKASGKMSSLFGNNPDIPMIGQRLVKPINEPIFTEVTFADFNIHPFMISNLEKNMHITKMTTVQQKTIPQIFSGRDILIRSQTGSGKTFAYALPIVELLHKIRPKLRRNSGLLALVVVPTRELVLQTYECFMRLIKPFIWIVPGYLCGGEKRKSEKTRLRKGCNILIVTPGRLLDHIRHTNILKLNEVRYFILDEADRMLDMRYEKDISQIISALKITSPSNEGSGYDAMKMFKQNVKKGYIDKETDSDEATEIVRLKKKNRSTEHSDVSQETVSEADNVQNIEQNHENVNQSKRQTILLSATLTPAVEKLAGLAMQNPIFVDVAKENLQVSGNEDVSNINEDLIVPQSVIQNYIVTPPKLRIVILSAYIVGRCQIPGEHKILIFMATQDMVDYYTDILSSVLTKSMNDCDEDFDPLVDIEFFKLHGNMPQKERTEVFKTFRQTKSGVLLCTDVAARGLDIPKVDCVIQYTGPISTKDYVHRIGRTARAGCTGTTIIFLTPPEIEFVRLLESRRIRITQKDMNDVLDNLLGPLSKHNSVHATAIALQNNFENLVLENRQLYKKACKAYVSWIRFYSSYPHDMREIFNRQELHLGHYAKSFALRDPPKRIGEFGSKLRKENSSTLKHNNRLSYKSSDGVTQKEHKSQDGGVQRTGLLKRVKMLNVSEYDSGLAPLKKKRKKQSGTTDQ